MDNMRYFASANTNKGFINRFDNILDYTRENFRYVIKGGSGTGKSTLMKRVANHFKSSGEQVEYFYCSSDKDSLDGIRLVNSNIAIVDGTSPHVTEAELPEIKDKIINVGEFINRDVSKFSEEIKDIVYKKSKVYKSLYKILETIGNLRKIKEVCRDDIVSENLEIIKNIPIKRGRGIARNLFITAISEDGKFSFVSDYKNVINLDVSMCEFNAIIDSYKKVLSEMKVDYISFIDCTNADGIYALYLNDSDVLIKYDDDKLFDSDYEMIAKTLYKKAGDLIKKAHDYHFMLEKYYIKSMDFKGLDFLTNKTITDIEERIKNRSN